MLQPLTFNSSATIGRTPIHIAFGVDGFYVAAMAITILSIVSTNPQTAFVFHVVTAALSSEDLKLLERLAGQLKITVQVHNLDQDSFALIPDKKSPTYAIYYRLFLCSFLKGRVSRVLYLDSDIVCLRALPPLPELDDAVAAVVLDTEQGDRNTAIGRGAGEPYFNSGVMYINVDRWNELNVTHKTIECLAKGSVFRFPDQDALNLILAGKIVVLDSQWNKMWEVFRANPDTCVDTIFLHYAGQKPWLQWNAAFLDPPFAQYLDHSPWPSKRLFTPATRKNKGQYARYLFKRGKFLMALFWYARFLCAPKRIKG